MFGTYFYHEILRKTIIAFGTLFNDIEIKHKDKSGNGFSQLKVPYRIWTNAKVFSKN